jgi:16S rRNA (adenine1518-N6/adenine1519-N6)-dimethyltransferase
MLAMPGSREYSRLSVMSKLGFKVSKLTNASKANFYPRPKVDSIVIHIKPVTKQVNIEEASIINLLMVHKKKLLRNAIVDSCKSLQISRSEAREIAESISESNKRVFQLEPSKLVEIAKEIEDMLYKMRT